MSKIFSDIFILVGIIFWHWLTKEKKNIKTEKKIRIRKSKSKTKTEHERFFVLWNVCLCIKWFIHNPCAHSIQSILYSIHFSVCLFIFVFFFFFGIFSLLQFSSCSICYYSSGVSACYLDLCDLITAYNKLHIHAICQEFITNVDDTIFSLLFSVFFSSSLHRTRQ